jgi:hypothetical protein
MGDLATLAVIEFLTSEDIPAIAYDDIRTDEYQDQDPGWDIAIAPKAEEWANAPSDPKNPKGAFQLTTASIKSSRLPKQDTLNQAIKIRDFKVFDQMNRGREIEYCTTSDLETQIYYDYNQSLRRGREVQSEDVRVCIQDRDKASEILSSLEIPQRYNPCYLAAWNGRNSIIEHSKKLEKQGEDRYWISFGKKMWFAPLKLGKSFSELPGYLYSS